MMSKQLSVFIENRKGRLSEVLQVLKDNKISIISLSLADTTEYGLLRLIVNDAINGKEVLTKEGFSTMLTDVFIINISHRVGSLQELLNVLNDNDVSVEYMYGLSIENDNAYVVLKTSDSVKTEKIFTDSNISMLSDREIAVI